MPVAPFFVALRLYYPEGANMMKWLARWFSKEPKEEKIPVDLTEAVAILESWMTEADKEKIRNSDPACYHHGFGTNVRNKWHLWERNTPLVQWFISTYGIAHADDISGIMMNSLWAKVRNEYYDPRIDVQRYKEHWARMGYDPLKEEV